MEGASERGMEGRREQKLCLVKNILGCSDTSEERTQCTCAHYHIDPRNWSVSLPPQDSSFRRGHAVMRVRWRC